MNAQHDFKKEPPSLEELLARRGIHKSASFDDYQDYIAERQQKGLRPKLINLPRIYAQGSMHLALNRIQSVRKFWSWSDKR